MVCYYLIWHDMSSDRSGKYQYNGHVVEFHSRASAERFGERLRGYFGEKYDYSVRSSCQQSMIDRLNERYGR